MFSLTAIKALAIALVTHSHMREYYPIREIATGGMLGNTLFFFSSGIGITLGLDRHLESFLRWYGKRIRRTYVQLWLITLMLLLFGIWPITDTSSLVFLFLAPIHYWFIPAIVALYPLCYILIRLNTTIFYFIVMALAGILYIIVYSQVVDFSRWNAEDHVGLKTLFYLMVMITGIYVAKTRLNSPVNGAGLLLLLSATTGFFGFLAVLKITGAYSLQAGANVLALIWALAVFRCLRYAPVEAWLQNSVGKPITFLSGLTLPIYLVQVPLITESRLYLLPFPANVIVFCGVVLGLAWLLDRLTNLGLDRLRRKTMITR